MPPPREVQYELYLISQYDWNTVSIKNGLYETNGLLAVVAEHGLNETTSLLYF